VAISNSLVYKFRKIEFDLFLKRFFAFLYIAKVILLLDSLIFMDGYSWRSLFHPSQT